MEFFHLQAKSGKNVPNAVAIRSPYLRVLGIEMNNHQSSESYFTEEEEREFVELAKKPDFVKFFASNLAPSIWGNDDLKLAMCCLLFGGSRKYFPMECEFVATSMFFCSVIRV